MNREIILVLGLPPDRLLTRLQDSIHDMALVVGSTFEDFQADAPEATIITVPTTRRYGWRMRWSYSWKTSSGTGRESRS
jgi:hypothetical protein